MSSALQGCEDFTAVYIDDILVFSDSVPLHLDHLREVFSRLLLAAYYVRLSKCSFLQLEVEFLGHRLSREGLATSGAKIEALCAWRPPLHSAKQTRQFLGLALWYKNFIPHLATIATPLFRLTSTKTRFI